MREHILYPAIYAAVKALPLDDDISGFDRVRDLLTLLKKNAPIPDGMLDIAVSASMCEQIYSGYLHGWPDDQLHRETRAEFLTRFEEHA